LEAAMLDGSAADDGQPENPGALTLAWTAVRAPGAVTFESPGRARTAVRFAVAGTYLLRLTASDGVLQAHDDVRVVVAPPAPQTELLAAYGFDEGAGSTIPDRAGHAPPLTRHGATWMPKGRHGGAMAFDGIRNRLEGPSISLPPTFTFMAWVLNDGDMPLETLVSVGNGRTLKLGLGAVIFATADGDLTLGPAGGHHDWQHVAVTYDGETVRAFVDGAPIGSPQPLVLGPVDGAVLVGAWRLGVPVDFFGGALDDLRLYGRALSAAEIARDMRTPIGGPQRLDTEPPRVTIDAPAEDEIVSDVVTLTASATDDVGVATVSFRVDGQQVGGDVTAAPFWVTWDTRTATNGRHVVEVTARDAAGNATTTAARTVAVTNPRAAVPNRPPVVSAGGDLMLARPGPALLEGTASDDGLPTPTLEIRWSMVSGPGVARFDVAAAPVTVVHFSVAGVYVLRLTATDGALPASDDVVVTVGPVGPPPPD
jgi:hypothetical protein